MKNKRSFTLTDDADALLNALSKKLGISKTGVIELAIREKAKKENVSVTPGKTISSTETP